jgi:hypothetical protein
VPAGHVVIHFPSDDYLAKLTKEQLSCMRMVDNWMCSWGEISNKDWHLYSTLQGLAMMVDPHQQPYDDDAVSIFLFEELEGDVASGKDWSFPIASFVLTYQDGRIAPLRQLTQSWINTSYSTKADAKSWGSLYHLQRRERVVGFRALMRLQDH